MRQRIRLIIDAETRVVVDETYLCRGRKHRDPKEGPARTRRNALTGALVAKEYWVRGRKHRDPKEGPAATYLLWGTRGEHFSEEYCVQGSYERDPSDGPVWIDRDPFTGVVYDEAYMLDGDYHRADGPACTSRDEAGRVIHSSYYWRGELHREDGPALLDRNPLTGEVEREGVEGVEASPPTRPRGPQARRGGPQDTSP
jgi:hypothetical protein